MPSTVHDMPEHVLPAQHGCPAPPHCAQLPPWHPSPDPVQTSLAQQATQLLFAHTTLAAVHSGLLPICPGQQG
jgi:hypothetical protein